MSDPLNDQGNDELSRGRANLEVVKQYLQAIERGAPFDEVGSYFTEDVVQREFPNRLVPAGATRGLKELAEAAARGRSVVSAQRYEIDSAIAVGDDVAIEAKWSATLLIPSAASPPAASSPPASASSSTSATAALPRRTTTTASIPGRAFPPPRFSRRTSLLSFARNA